MFETVPILPYMNKPNDIKFVQQWPHKYNQNDWKRKGYVMYLEYVSLNWTASANLKGTQMPKT